MDVDGYSRKLGIIARQTARSRARGRVCLGWAREDRARSAT
jgi:hypothetical protein